MAVPTIDPIARERADVAPTDSYRRDDPVWVYRCGQWYAGVVEISSSRAATVTYRAADTRATSVDTLTARYLLARSDVDPVLDRAVTV